MADLSQDQAEMQSRIRRGAAVWGAVAGAIVGLLALWLLGGQGAALRYGVALVAAAGAGFLVFRASFNSGAKSARCAACGTAFSRSRTDRSERLKSSEAKEEREVQADKSVEVTTWTEERYEVTDTYSCARCGDVTTNIYETTRRRDAKTAVEPAAAERKSATKPESDRNVAEGRKPAGAGRKARGRSSRV